MTEAEVLEAVALYIDTSISSIALYASFIFAYLTTAYFVGEKLTNYQARMVSILYVASTGIMVASSFGTVHAWIHIVETHKTLLDEVPIFMFHGWHYSLGTIMIAGIFAGLYFMHDVRRRRQEG